MRFVRQSTANHCFAELGLRDHQPVGIETAHAGAGLRRPALRISEILRLQWNDMDFDNQCIHVRRAYVYAQFGKPNSKASKRSRSIASGARRSFAQLAARDSIQQPGGPGISVLAAEWKQSSLGQHAVVRPPSTGGGNDRDSGSATGLRVSYLPAHAGVGAGGQQLRSQTRPGTVAPLEHQNHSGHLRPSHYDGQARGTRSVSEPVAQQAAGRAKGGSISSRQLVVVGFVEIIGAGDALIC